MWAWTATLELKRAMWRRAACGFGQTFARVGFVEEDLALEIGRLDEVAVDEGERADAGACEQRGRGRAHGSAAHDGNMRLASLLLPAVANAREKDLARVAIFLRDGFRTGQGCLRRFSEAVPRLIRLNASFFVV